MSFGYIPPIYVPDGQVENFDQLIAGIFSRRDIPRVRIDGLHQVRCVAGGAAYNCTQSFSWALAPAQGFAFVSLPRDGSNTPKSEHLFIGFVSSLEMAQAMVMRLGTPYRRNVTFRDIGVVKPYPVPPGSSPSL